MLARLLAVILLIVSFSLPAAADSLEIWTSSESIQRALQELAAPFEERTGVKVNVTVLNKDLTSQFKTAALTNKGPDIFTWAHDVVGELAASGLLEPIALPSELQAALTPATLEALTYQGSLYGYPYNVEAVALITNPTLLPSVPESFEELATWAQNFRQARPDHYGLLFDLKSFFFSFGLLSARGGYIFGLGETGGLNPADLGLTSAGMIEGARFLQRLAREGITPSSTDRSIAFDLFRQGKLAAMIDGPWAVSDLRRAQVPFEVHPLPKLGGEVARPFIGSHAFFVRRSSPMRILAMELIEREFLTPAGVAGLYRFDPRGPSRADALSLIGQNLDEHALSVLTGFGRSAAQGVPMPNIPQMGAIWSSMGQALNAIINENRDVEASLQHAQNQVQHALTPVD
jgi:maltose/maltodextrin transport system substrate-binding protein